MKTAVPVPCEAGETPVETVITLDNIPGWQIISLFFD
jgi:hypothetical protein